MTWTLPCAGRVTSPYGPRILAAGMFPFHYGVDVAAGRGPVFAAQHGIVRTIWITSKGGWVVDIRHPDEGGRQVRTRYIHMDFEDIRVKAGQKVKAGDWIGNSGTSGSPGSPHLHFETLVNGQLVDPVPFMAARGLTFGTSLVSNVIGGVGVPPDAPAVDALPTPPAPRKAPTMLVIRGIAKPEVYAYDGATKRWLENDAAVTEHLTALGQDEVLVWGQFNVDRIPLHTVAGAAIDYAALAKAVNDDAARRLAS